MAKNADRVDETLAAIRQVIPDFSRSELHLNVGHESGHYFDNLGYPVEQRHHADVLRAIDHHRRANGASLHPGEVPRGPLPGADRQVLRDAQVAAAVHGAVLVLLHRRVLEPVRLLDLGRRRSATCARTRFDLACAVERARVVASCERTSSSERCSHCWTPCEAYPTILGNLARAATSRGSRELEPLPAETL